MKQNINKEQTKQFDDYEKSAIMFNALSKQFRKMSYDLVKRKKRAASRVLEALLFEPLEEVPLFGKEEKELLDIAKQVIYHKMMIGEYAAIKQEQNEENLDEQK